MEVEKQQPFKDSAELFTAFANLIERTRAITEERIALWKQRDELEALDCSQEQREAVSSRIFASLRDAADRGARSTCEYLLRIWGKDRGVALTDDETLRYQQMEAEYKEVWMRGAGDGR